MKRLFAYILVIALSVVSFQKAEAAVAFQNEKLHYVISYKWGLVHKDAGEATLSLRNVGNDYRVMLAARTKPWADKFYSVRDTLSGVIARNGLLPKSYKKVTHEKGTHKRDEISYSRVGNITKGVTKRYRYDKKGKMTVKNLTLQSNGPVYDMLSIFYYLRQLDYSQLSRNKVYKATVFSGRKKEIVTIRSLGVETIKLRNNPPRQAYHIKFRFTQEGGKKSSEDMDTWISTDAAHIPLYLVGQLPVGEVRAYYMP